MNERDLMKAVGGIDSGTIERYADPSALPEAAARRQARKKRTAAWLISAAAAIMIGFGIFAAVRAAGASEREHSALTPTRVPQIETPPPVSEASSPAVTEHTGVPGYIDPDPDDETEHAVLQVMGGNVVTHSYNIIETVIRSTDKEKTGRTARVEFAGRRYELAYAETLHYVIGGVTADRYAIIGADEGQYALLLPDGTLYALHCDVVSLDIKATDSSDTVRAAVEAALGGEIDFRQFEGCEARCSIEDRGNGFGMYTFTWYNKIGDIRTAENLQLCVTQDGTVGALRMRCRAKLGLENVPRSIDLLRYMRTIERMLMEIYGVSLIDFDIEDACLTRLNGSPCIDCVVSVHCFGDDGRWSEACELVIMVGR